MRKWRKVLPMLVLPIFCTIIIGLLMWWTYSRNAVWNDEVRIWMDSVKKSPNKSRPYNNVGSAFLKMQGVDLNQKMNMAAPWIIKAIELDKDSIEAHNNLAIILSNHGKYEEAIFHLKIAVKIRPYSWEIRNNMGLYLAALGKYDEAVVQLKESIRINPYVELSKKNLERIEARRNHGH
jgi:Tfp pilus assembly protein PilF